MFQFSLDGRAHKVLIRWASSVARPPRSPTRRLGVNDHVDNSEPSSIIKNSTAVEACNLLSSSFFSFSSSLFSGVSNKPISIIVDVNSSGVEKMDAPRRNVDNTTRVSIG